MSYIEPPRYWKLVNLFFSPVIKRLDFSHRQKLKKIIQVDFLFFSVSQAREMERNRKSASLITQSVLIISIENSFVLTWIRSLEKVQKKTARHAKKAGFYMAVA